MGLLVTSCSKEEGSRSASESSLQDVTSLSEYNDKIADGVSLFFFHATWCPKCAAQRPAVESLVNDASLNRVFFGQVDYEKITEVVSSAKVVGFPTIVLYKNGVEAARFSGQGHSSEKIKGELLGLVE